MANNINPQTKEAAFTLASHLTFEDKRECTEGHGIDPFLLAIGALSGDDSYYFKAPDGKSAAIGGVENDGKIWMLCTDSVNEYPRTFARDCKRMIDSRPEKLLWNVVDKRNTTHIKLLRFLGFKFLREVLYGPNLLTFIEFCKINVR